MRAFFITLKALKRPSRKVEDAFTLRIKIVVIYGDTFCVQQGFSKVFFCLFLSADTGFATFILIANFFALVNI